MITNVKQLKLGEVYHFIHDGIAIGYWKIESFKPNGLVILESPQDAMNTRGYDAAKVFSFIEGVKK